MSPALVPWRAFLLALIVITGLLFVLGILHYNSQSYGCLDGKGYYGDWVTTFSVGKFEFRQRAWGCDASQRYDPKQFHKGTTIYVPSGRIN